MEDDKEREGKNVEPSQRSNFNKRVEAAVNSSHKNAHTVHVSVPALMPRRSMTAI